MTPSPVEIKQEAGTVSLCSPTRIFRAWLRLTLRVRLLGSVNSWPVTDLGSIVGKVSLTGCDGVATVPCTNPGGNIDRAVVVIGGLDGRDTALVVMFVVRDSEWS